MGQNEEWHERRKEIPTDTPLNPETMVSMDESRGDFVFPYSGELEGTSGEAEEKNHFRGEVSKREKE
ncbi:MAG TPA: hypothetical protein VFT51_01940 [Bacillales bacterium]|nr:hypothetical protein [Bacillales bacterium]